MSATGFKDKKLLWTLLAAIGIASCSDGDAPTQTSASSAAVTTILNTFITDSLEIDQLNSSPPEDANLYVGLDPADGSASAQKPTGGPSTWIDWHDLGGDLENHRLLDLDGPSGKDPSSFPRSNECVGPSQVLSKMDLTYVGSANNNEFAYLIVQRSDNNGDAGYYWLFTRKEPKLIPDQEPCRPGEFRLVYDISGPNASTGAAGDVLVQGHFKPSSSIPLVGVYLATQDMDGLGAVDAIDFSSGLWQKNPSAVAAAAVNTTYTAPGAFGSAGVKAKDNQGNLEPEIVAEAAIPISIFTGGSVCGNTFYGSVITRSSGSGGTSPDPKDLAGPALFNFGSVDATASLTPTCGLELGYSATATAPDGSPLSGAQCSWKFFNGSTQVGTSSTCSGSFTVPSAGDYSAEVTVTDPVSSCGDTKTTNTVSLHSPMSVTPTATATCSSSFTYDASVSGGSNPSGVFYAWTFSGGGTTTPTSSTTKSGTVAVGKPGVSYTASLVVTDPRTDITCTASGSASAIPYAPLVVSLTPRAPAPTCPSTSSDAVTYDAVASGGNGSYSYIWSDGSCSGGSCTIDPSDSTFCYSQDLYVTLSDSSWLCPPAKSETESYSKITTITASDN